MDNGTTKRLFVGITLPTDHLDAFATLRQQTAPQPELRWIPEENLHITAFFFGKVLSEQQENLQALLTLALRNQEPFVLQFRQFQFAPKPQAPRMIWARYVASEAFVSLAQSIGTLYQQIAPDHQTRYRPKPHVTLARLKAIHLDQVPLQTVRGPQTSLSVSELVLWESVLRPEGPEYLIQKRYPL